MNTGYLAIIVPVDDLEIQSAHALYGAVWSRVSTLLLTQLGKRFTRFEPASLAWRQEIDHPFGVIMGKKDPARFLYFYHAARQHQEAAIRFHMDGFLNGVGDISKAEYGNMAIFTVKVNGNNEAVTHHMLWHASMLGGELLPDGGIYYLAEKESFATDQLDQKVLFNLEGYALCMVALSTDTDGGERDGH